MFAYKIVKEWVLPPKVFRFFLRCAANLYRSPSLKDRKILDRNSIFIDRYKGRRCFVIGNGPSLNKVDLSQLKNEITIVMNHFDYHPILEKWQPTIYCSADGPNTYTPYPEGRPEELELMKRVSKKIFPEGFFLSLSIKAIVETNNMFPKDKTYYLDMRKDLSLYEGLTSNDIDLTKQIPAVINTAMLAIIIAMAIGCKKIYLLGVDHDYLARPDRWWCDFHEWLYKNDKANLPPPPETGCYRAVMEVMLGMYKCHDKIYQYALKNNIEIINVTDGSYLDEYPRAKFEDIV